MLKDRRRDSVRRNYAGRGKVAIFSLNILKRGVPHVLLDLATKFLPFYTYDLNFVSMDNVHFNVYYHFLESNPVFLLAVGCALNVDIVYITFTNA